MGSELRAGTNSHTGAPSWARAGAESPAADELLEISQSRQEVHMEPLEKEGTSSLVEGVLSCGFFAL